MRENTGNESNMDLEQFLEDIKKVIRDGQDLLKTSISGVKEQAMAGAETTGEMVREQPYKMLGIAFGLGLLAGVLAGKALTREPEEAED